MEMAALVIAQVLGANRSIYDLLDRELMPMRPGVQLGCVGPNCTSGRAEGSGASDEAMLGRLFDLRVS